MRGSMLFGTGVLAMCLVVGCGGSSPEEALMKDQLKLMNDQAALLEKVTDKASFEKAQEEMKKIMEKQMELMKKIGEITAKTPQKLEALEKTYKPKMEEAATRLKKATAAAIEKAMK